MNSNIIPAGTYEYVGCGSYGSIYSLRDSSLVFKVHSLEQVCEAWDHEYKMQVLTYCLCEKKLQKQGVSIAKPYLFHFATHTEKGFELSRKSKGASVCLFDMDRITSGANTKWDSLLLRPLQQRTLPPYLFMGTLEEGPNRLTPAMFQHSRIQELPNEAYSYCEESGPFAHRIMASMHEAFFILSDAGFVPRDIEFVLDGRPETSSLIAIIDFNEVQTDIQRKRNYGEGYDVSLDLAHVYIDLCGLRSKTTRNPMAPYDVPTPQWKFMCNPLTTPSTFCRLFQDRVAMAQIILHYALVHTILPTVRPIRDWKPLFVFRVSDLSDVILEEGEEMLGSFTEKEYCTWRNGQAHFSSPSDDCEISEERHVYVRTMNHKREPYVYDIFLEFDIQFQYYILSSLLATAQRKGKQIQMPSWSFDECLQMLLSELQQSIPVSESWSDV
jgi:hypothetical protein